MSKDLGKKLFTSWYRIPIFAHKFVLLISRPVIMETRYEKFLIYIYVQRQIIILIRFKIIPVVGINGFGRIGRMCLRACIEKDITVNDITILILSILIHIILSVENFFSTEERGGAKIIITPLGQVGQWSVYFDRLYDISVQIWLHSRTVSFEIRMREWAYYYRRYLFF